MSSNWRPLRRDRFAIWLAPPGGADGSRSLPGPGNACDDSAAQPALAGSEAVPGAWAPVSRSGGPAPEFMEVDSRSWTAGVVSSDGDARVALECMDATTPPQRLHPKERQKLESMAPAERAAARKLLAAARRAMAAVLGVPEAGIAAVADLSPLLDGAQSLRAGDWSVQRVPAPVGVYVFAAARGAGWGYRLIPAPRPHSGFLPGMGETTDGCIPEGSNASGSGIGRVGPQCIRLPGSSPRKRQP